MENILAAVKALVAWLQNLLDTIKEFVDGFNKHYDFETAE